MKKNRWSEDDRQRFKDRDVLKSRSVPAKRRPPPSSREWEEEGGFFIYQAVSRTGTSTQDYGLVG